MGFDPFVVRGKLFKVNGLKHPATDTLYMMMKYLNV
jgi:hypothetical protein